MVEGTFENWNELNWYNCKLGKFGNSWKTKNTYHSMFDHSSKGFICFETLVGRRRYPLDDEDEELAAAMRESLDLYHSPRFKSDMMPTFRPSHGGCVHLYLPIYHLKLVLGFFVSKKRKQIDLYVVWICFRKPPTMGTCAGCKQPLGYGRYLTCINKNWHPNCFSCKTCNKPITDREVSMIFSPLLQLPYWNHSVVNISNGNTFITKKSFNIEKETNQT